MTPPLLNSTQIVININSGIVSSDFPASVVLLSQSLQFGRHKKIEIKRFFYFSIDNSKYVMQCKAFSHEHTAATNNGTSGRGRLVDRPFAINDHMVRGGGQACYYSRTGTSKQRQVKFHWFRSLCFKREF